MKKNLLILCSLFSYILQAQTKLIHHRSHSGSDENFKEQLVENTITNSNLGVAPTHIVRTARLDSLIFVNDSTAVMITSRFCKDDYAVGEEPSKWRAGKDTVRRHPLFCKQHQLDKIKRTIKNDYNFNDVINIKYIGYDNAEVPILIKPIIKPKPKPKPKSADIPPPTQKDNFSETYLHHTDVIIWMASLLLFGFGYQKIIA
jgi:hypothetical protein